MLAREEILSRLKTYLETMFEVSRENVTLDARLFEDLDLDSIDAVDLIVELQELTGRKFNPQEFKTVRTVGDLLDRVHDIVQA